MAGHSSVLLIGKNGSGKTAVGLALEVLQKIARGTNWVDTLVEPKDFTRGRTDVPMRFEIEVELNTSIYEYAIAFDLPDGSKEMRVFEETLVIGGKPIYTRKREEVLAKTGSEGEPIFGINTNVVILPIVLEQTTNNPLFIFKQWLARMIILRPIPSLIIGDSEKETLEPNPDATNFGAWFSGLLAYTPAAYNQIDSYLKQVMPDLKDIKNPTTGKNSRSLVVQFSNDQGNLSLPFEDLSDGEKCFMICALVLASNDAYGPLLCFWDEPDNYLALSEVGHFVLALRKAFQSKGQFIATSHNHEAIYRFPEESTLLLYRDSHLEHTLVRPISQLQINGDLLSALVTGDLEP